MRNLFWVALCVFLGLVAVGANKQEKAQIEKFGSYSAYAEAKNRESNELYDSIMEFLEAKPFGEDDAE